MDNYDKYARAELLIAIAKVAADVESKTGRTATLCGMPEIIIESLKMAKKLLTDDIK